MVQIHPPRPTDFPKALSKHRKAPSDTSWGLNCVQTFGVLDTTSDPLNEVVVVRES